MMRYDSGIGQMQVDAEGQKMTFAKKAAIGVMALIASDIVIGSSYHPSVEVVDRALAPVNEPSAVLGTINIPREQVERAPSVTFEKSKLQTFKHLPHGKQHVGHHYPPF